MSTPGGPSKRRRIAGESTPGTAAAKPVARRTVKKPAGRPGRSRPETPAPAAPTEPDDAFTEAPATPSTPRIRPAGRGRRSRATPDTTDPDASAQEEAGTAAAFAKTGEHPDTDLDSDGSSKTESNDSARSHRPRPPRGLVLLTLVAVAAIVFGAVFGVRGWQAWGESRGLQASHGEAADAAATAAETIFGYRFDRLDQHLEESQELMTDSFAQEFESISPALNDLAPQRQIQVESTTRDAAALPCGDECSSSRAQVLVFIDQARVADGEEEPTVFGNRVTMTMVQTDGEWLVDDVTAL